MEVEVYHPLKTLYAIATDHDKMSYELHLAFIAKENMSEKPLASPAEVTAKGELELKK